jgi:hypothetical protein
LGNKDGKEAEEPKKKIRGRRKVEVSVPTLRKALEAIATINCFCKAAAGNSKKLLQIMDTKEHLENLSWACDSIQEKSWIFFRLIKN